MSTGYVLQKLWEALYALVGIGTIQQRLCSAGNYLVQIQPVDLIGVEANDRVGFEAVLKRLTCVRPEPHEGLLDATTQRLTDAECEKLATQILELYTSVRGGIEP